MVINALYKRNEVDEENISKEFYSNYKQMRVHLFQHIKQHNPGKDEILLLEKAQKILDRFIFVCFCEDTGLLPGKIFRKIMTLAKESFSYEENKIWKELKGLFRAIDKGLASHGINAFNGSLFAADPVLDLLTIGDEMFEELAKITDYDFESDLNVNILGHILEQSISDLEELRAEIRGEENDRKKGKRKKEGIYYTPEFITKYIVENAVGGWLEDRKNELGLDELPLLTEEDYKSVKTSKNGLKFNENIEKHIVFWEAYREKLMSIKVLDPACGSGAFLNQAFDFLYKEGRKVNKVLAKLRGGQKDIFDLDKYILQSNLYGVDLNREAVEITKLSLWLKTADKYSRLTTLDDNIKCGNSLIDDLEIAGPKAFKWEKEFPGIMHSGGFDVVISNPPYIAIEAMNENEKDYYKKEYKGLERKYDSSAIFILKGLELLKSNGLLSYISSITWQTGENYLRFRERIIQNNDLKKIVNLPFDVFSEAYVDTGIYVIGKEKKEEFYEIFQYPKNIKIKALNGIKFERINKENIREPDYKIVLTENINSILEKICSEKFELLGNISDSTQGLAGNKFKLVEKEDENVYPYLTKGQIYRYQFIINKVDYTGMSSYPTLKKYYINNERILIRRIINRQNRLMASYYNQDLIVKKDMNPFIVTDKKYNIFYLLAIINSKLISFLYLNQSTIATKDDFRQTTLSEIRKLPIYKANKEEQEFFIKNAKIMLELNKQLHGDVEKFTRFIETTYKPKRISNKLKEFYTLSFPEFINELKRQKVSFTRKEEFELIELFAKQKEEALSLKNQIDKTGSEIDKMVYDIYGLSEEEIQIVESA